MRSLARWAPAAYPLWHIYSDLWVEQSRPARERCPLHVPGMFLYEAGAKDAPCRVRFLVPHGGRIATGLDQRGGGADPAHDYNILVDAPTEMGSLEMTDSEMDSAAA